MNNYTCELCRKKITKGFSYGDEFLCEDCFDDAESRMENAYDVARDEE